MDNNNEIIMYIIINSDLKMSKGKIAAQVGHAVMWITYKLRESEILSKWMHQSYTKIILKATGKQIVDLKYKFKDEMFTWIIFDEGRTEIKPNSLTAIGFEPMERSKTPTELKKLRLL